MRLLTLEIGGQIYAIDTAQVVEVAPLVELQPAQPGGPVWLTGRMLYRGTLIPVIDLALLLANEPAPAFYSTRLVVTRISAGSLAALVAPKAVETIVVAPSDLREPAVRLVPLPYLGQEILHARGAIQCLLPDGILASHLGERETGGLLA